MSQSYDRRVFLRKGAQGAAAAAAVGIGGGLLEACGSSAGGGSTTVPQAHGVTNHGKPTYGGSLVIGTWSEVNGLSPPTATWDATGYLYGNAIFDSLVQIGADGKPHAYLAQSITPNPDYTVWTIKLRPGVEFHDGEAFDAKACVTALEAAKSGLVTGQTLKPVETITDTDSMTVQIKVSQPWPAFPAYLAGQIGYMPSPKMLASKGAGATNPIGTGPYLFEQWTPNVSLTLKKNPRYWQHGYPYLDNLEFKPILDNATRSNALTTGEIQLMHCQSPQTIKPYFTNSKFQVITPVVPKNGEPTVDFIMLNTGIAPMNDLNVRKALAMSIDREVLRESYGANLTQAMNGPFSPGTIWYTNTNFPQYNPSEAKRLISEYAARTGGAPSITLTTIQGPDYLAVADVVQQGWQAAGVKVSVGQVEFAQFVVDAVTGKYQACTFEQFGASDPDQNYIWWSTETIGPEGGVSLNMTHNSDTRIQAALTTGRTSTDLPTRVKAYQEVSRYLAEDLPYIWLDATYWAAIADANVVGVTGQTLPDGAKSEGFSGGALLVHQLALTN